MGSIFSKLLGKMDACEKCGGKLRVFHDGHNNRTECTVCGTRGLETGRV